MNSILESFKVFYETKILGYINMMVEYPIKLLALAVDLAIVFYLLYKLIKMIKGTRAVQLIKGIAVLLIANVLSEFLSLNILHYILNSVVTYGVLLFIVVFQPELRKTLEQMGSTNIRRFFDIEDTSSLQSVDEVVLAVEQMAKDKTGALIVYEKESSLGEIMHTGVAIDADISKELLLNIFVPDTPLHDGAVVIKRDFILAASVYYTPTTKPLTGKYGSRHRAAIGISEITDSVTVVVSEETGRISLAVAGELIPVNNETFLRTFEEYMFEEDNKAKKEN